MQVSQKNNGTVEIEEVDLVCRNSKRHSNSTRKRQEKMVEGLGWSVAHLRYDQPTLCMCTDVCACCVCVCVACVCVCVCVC